MFFFHIFLSFFLLYIYYLLFNIKLSLKSCPQLIYFILFKNVQNAFWLKYTFEFHSMENKKKINSINIYSSFNSVNFNIVFCAVYEFSLFFLKFKIKTKKKDLISPISKTILIVLIEIPSAIWKTLYHKCLKNGNFYCNFVTREEEYCHIKMVCIRRLSIIAQKRRTRRRTHGRKSNQIKFNIQNYNRKTKIYAKK